MKTLSKANPPRIGIDLLGSDTSPKAFLAHLERVRAEFADQAEFLLFGDSQTQSEQFDCILAREAISMDENPLTAVRLKRESSLCLGVEMLKRKEIDAFVSAGNTGALVASAKVALPMLPGIARPALLALMPTQKEEVAVIDIGANISYKVEHLLQFASMGIAYQKTRGVKEPTVGLLNIGTEQKKGTPALREAYKRLQALNRREKHPPLFVGNVEGRDVFRGGIDVLVTDGFTGNIFLKTAEGIAGFILDELWETMGQEAPTNVKEVFGALHHRLSHTEFPGAIICGIDGIVVKCHGNATPSELISSIKSAIRLTEHSFLAQIKAQLASNC